MPYTTKPIDPLVSQSLRRESGRRGLTCNKSPSEPELSDDPTAPSQWTNEVSTKVGCLKTTRPGSSNIQVNLEFGIERIEQTVAIPSVSIPLMPPGHANLRETPEPEQNRHKSAW